MREHVLLLGVSTRAAAESAAGAGLSVTSLDAFGDRDQHPDVRAYACLRDFNLPFRIPSLLRAARSLPGNAVAYLSPIENDRHAVATLARGRALWGNPPEVLERVRNPARLREVLSRNDVMTPDIRAGAGALAGTNARGWLAKPLASGGGGAVRVWHPRSRLRRTEYLQESIDGTVGSVVFVAANGRTIVLGLSRQLVGDAAFGAHGFRYCGSILAGAGDPQFDDDRELVTRARDAADVVARTFGLVGVNGVDFVARGGTPFVIEVNPRWSSSMEVVERAYGVSVFGMHAGACVSQTLPAFDVDAARRGSGATGRAVVYARSAVAVGDTTDWLADPDVRDVPHAGEVIGNGMPVCSVFAAAADGASCYEALVARAARVYADCERWALSASG